MRWVINRIKCWWNGHDVSNETITRYQFIVIREGECARCGKSVFLGTTIDE